MNAKSPPAINSVFAAAGMAICGVCHGVFVAVDWRLWAFFGVSALFALQALARWDRDRA